MSISAPPARDKIVTVVRKGPPRFSLIIHANPYEVPPEVVAHILFDHFGKSKIQGLRIMRDLHKSMVGLIGLYSKDVGETMIEQARGCGWTDYYNTSLTFTLEQEY